MNKHITDDFGALVAALNNCIDSSGNSLGLSLLDLRGHEFFWAHHVCNSVNIPLTELNSKAYLLPDKHEEFAVIIPSETNVDILKECELQGCSSVPSFFETRGWNNIAFYVTDSATLWAAASHLKLIEYNTHSKRRWLFSPSTFLVQAISDIESRLQEQLVGRKSHEQTRFRCLDVGCGSGRDAAWLLLPRTNSKSPTGIFQGIWDVVALDSWLGALKRCSQLFKLADAKSDRVLIVHAEVSPVTGLIVPLDSSSRQSKLLYEGNVTEVKHGSFDALLCIRFLNRLFLGEISKLLKQGGFVIYSTFLDMPGVREFGRPQGEKHLLQPHELAQQWFGPDQGFKILQDDIITASDGREMCHFVAQKQ